jgi:UDPglucose--hexose-1-phosphate uridylyltransferase
VNVLEVRNHYFRHEQVIISEKRMKRPHDLVEGKAELPKEEFSEKCPFCKGNEKMTPPTSYCDAKKDWKIRCFSNKFPLLDSSIKFKRTKNRLFNKMSGYGFHEVIVETPYHNKQWQQMKVSDFELIFEIYKKRYENFIKKPDIKYVMMFKNYGLAGGASLVHSHSQLLATPFVPSKIMRDVVAIADYSKKYFKCPFCDIIEKEKNSSRMVMENKDFIVISPYCARYPFEMWVLPKDHIKDFNSVKIRPYASIIQRLVKRMFDVLGDFSFNMFVHDLPKKLEAEFHLHVSIQPRIKKEASVEMGYGTKVNTVPPEKAARYLREK